MCRLGSLFCFAYLVVLPMGIAHSQTPGELSVTAMRALEQGDRKLAIQTADQMLKASPQNSGVKMRAGDIFLRAGESKRAVAQFDAFLKDEPQQLPYLWQRGIALYFTSDFAEGVKQFEVHRGVNPNDVENAAWHFLCVARAKSFDKAKGMVLPAPGDPRLPMKEVLQMLNTGDTQAVIDRIEKETAGTPQRSQAEFYGYFYLGLYEDAQGDREEALRWMRKSAKDAPRNYMGDVARVYVDYLANSKNVNQ
ncbi:tetratricopeptide repeat protein [Rubripirellula sp.]|jgi:lipoprotein NlpI|nr:tetratricopeptide repeat protein [Rubripirellula sp.]MDF1841421.1 tetratricopeptide repeat protein [Rubripirellula sp.]